MSESGITLSVIIPVYNAEKTLDQTLDSLLGQSLKEIEIICVDDGSTDGSVALIEEYRRKDPRVRLEKQKNLYAGIARNTGIDAARGEWLFFMDADDYVADYALESVCRKAERYRLDCLRFRSITLDEQTGRFMTNKRNDCSEVKAEEFDRLLDIEEDGALLKISVAPWAGIVRRAFVLEKNCRFNGLRCVNDRSFFTKVITNAKRIMITTDRVTVHRANQQRNSLVDKKGDHFDCQIGSVIITEKQLGEDRVDPEKAELIMEQEYRDLVTWYGRYYTNPDRKKEMDRQIEAYLNGGQTAYGGLLEFRMADYFRNPLRPEKTKEIKAHRTEGGKIRVSVLMPVPEEWEHLGMALYTLSRQKGNDFEFLMLCGKTCRAVWAEMKEYEAADSRFRIIEAAEAAPEELMDAGLAAARGEFACILNGGAVPETEMIEDMADKARLGRPDSVKAEEYSLFRRNAEGYSRQETIRPGQDTPIRYEGAFFFPEKCGIYRLDRKKGPIRFRELNPGKSGTVRGAMYAQDMDTLKPAEAENGKGEKRMESGRGPAISVIMAVYNAEDYLEECLKSVLEGSFRDIEVICVDDGSTDGSPEILKRLAEKDSRVRVVRTENGGAGAARNAGLALARGEYCSFLDADDFFEKDMLERAWKKVKAEDLDMAVFPSDNYYTDTERFSGRQGINAGLVPKKRPFAGTDIPMNTFRVFIGWAWDKLIRTSFIREEGLKFEEIRTSNDLTFVFTAVACAKRINVTDSPPLAHHRRYSGSISTTRAKNWDCFYKALKALKANLVSKGLYERFERDFINYALYFSIWQMTTVPEDGFLKMYEKLSTEWLEEFGIADKARTYFYDPDEYEMMTKIRELSPTEFLLYSVRERQGKLKAQNRRLKADNDEITASFSFRAGQAVTWVPRKIHTTVRKIKEDGAGRTFRKILRNNRK